MTGKNARQNALVRLVSANGAVLGSDFIYPLLPTQDMVIGREPQL